MPRPSKVPDQRRRRPPGTGSVIKRADGRIAVTLPKDLDAKRRAIYSSAKHRPFSSIDQATSWLDAELARRRAPPATVGPDELLGTYLDRWYRSHEPDWSERTRLAYVTAILRWEPIARLRLRALTRETIQAATADLQRATWQRTKRDGTPTTDPRPYSRRTLQLSRTVLHQALEDLVPDVLTYNPAKLRRRPRPLPAVDAPVWSAEQATAFLAASERHAPHLALLYRLILRRGLRIGEATALTWSDVDERASTLTIDETPGIKRGISGPTKTRRVRDIPLSADLLARIKAHRHAYPATDPHLFTLAGRWVATDYVLAWWHRTARLARLPKITPRDGRATCSTILLDQGMPLPEVSRLLGHTTIAVTSAHYARVIQRRSEQVRQAGELMDRLLDSAARGQESDVEQA